MARDANFDLARALGSPSFTPGARDAPALVELVVAGEEPAAQRAANALAKLGAVGHKAVDVRLAGGGPVGGDTAELGDASTARLIGVLGLLARGGDAAALEALVARTRDAHVRVRRAAISALGKTRGDAARDALVARWDGSDVTPDERRALVEALGKIGGDDVLARLKTVDAGDDAELQRRLDRARLMIVRTQSRSTESAIDIERPLPFPLAVVLRCKRGLASLLVEELGQHGLKARADGDEAATLQLPAGRTWSALHASRLWQTAAFRVALPEGANLVERVRKALASKVVRENLIALTTGEVRYRLAFPSGKRRAVIWELAKQLDFLNDPTDSTWEFLVDDERGHVEIVPRKAPDPRFTWRVAEVPAASHPTVAAALARVAGAQPTDRVWDPFVGSGAELVERARLAPFKTLVGSDLEDTALVAARANIDAAGLTARLQRGDARSFDPGTVDLIITNPPLGSRVHVDAGALLVAALPHFAKVLDLAGRLVWITPATRKTSPAAESLGLRRTRSIAVDLGGVRGHLERWER